MGEHRREQLQKSTVCDLKGPPCRGIAIGPDPALGDLEIVITERVPEERSQAITSLRELPIGQLRRHVLDLRVQRGQQPPVDGGQLGGSLRRAIARETVDEPRGVPEFLQSFCNSRSPATIPFSL